MLFAIESIVLCALFALLIIPRTRKNPLWQLSSYPPAIIERVRSLSQYEGKLPSERKNTDMENYAKMYEHYGCTLYNRKTALNGITRYNLVWNECRNHGSLIL